MASNIERDIQTKVQSLKKGIKELHNILGQIYTHARKSNNNKLIFIKRDTDKLNAVSNYLNNLELNDPKIEKKGSTFHKEMQTLYKSTLTSISKMQGLMRRQEAAEKKDNKDVGTFSKDQKNLDNLRLALGIIRQMGIGLSFSKQDWNEIDTK